MEKLFKNILQKKNLDKDTHDRSHIFTGILWKDKKRANVIFELCQVVFEQNQMVFEQNQVIVFNVSRHCGSNVCCSACPVKRGISEVAKISKEKGGKSTGHYLQKYMKLYLFQRTAKATF